MIRRPSCTVCCIVLTLAAFLLHSRPASAQTGLVAAYGFNEGSGTTTADASGNGQTGTLNGATWNAAGRFGGALSFNGTTNWVTVPDTALIRLTTAMTVEAWVNATALANWRTVVLKESGTGLCYSLYASDASSRPSGWIRRTSDVGATSGSSIATNTWVHLATTYDGSRLITYVNGAQVASTSVTGSIATSTQPLRIGGNAIWGEFFTGKIDEVRVYNRALTAAQIQTDMVTAIAAAAPPPPPTPDFTLSATPPSPSVVAGSATSYTVTVGALNGFTGTVTLGVSGLPAGATATPASVAAPGTATVTVTTAASTPTGSSTLTFTGTSGALSHSAPVSLTVNAPPVPDFTLAASPATQSVVRGGSVSYTVSVAALNGFSGTVSLAISGLPADASGAFAPAAIAPGATSTLTVSTASTTPTGSSTLVVTGTSAALVHSASAGLAVNPPGSGPTIGIDFVGTGTAMAKTESAGVVPIRNWNSATGASRTSPLALVDQNNAATAATVVWSAAATRRLPTSDVAGNARMMRGYLDTTASSVTTVSVAGLPSASYNVYVYGDGANGADSRSAIYAISGPGITAASIGLTDAANVNFTSAFTQASGSNGNYVRFTITGTSFTLTATPGAAGTTTKRAPVNAIEVVAAGPPVPDFSIAMTPASASVVRGGSTSYTVTVTAIDGFTGSVTLAASGLPAGASAGFAPAVLTGGGTSSLTITTDPATPIGSSTVTATGTSGSLTRAATTSLAVSSAPVPDFAMTAQPASASVVSGGNASYVVTLSALNGFAGAVALAVSGLPANATAAFTPASVDVPGTATLVVTTTAATAAGTFALTATGTSGTLVRTTPLSLTVNGPTFSVSGVITPAALGGTATVNIGGASTASTVADSAGAYRFTSLANGAYQVTPSKNGITFTPANRQVTVAGADLTGIDFTAAQSPNSVSITSPSSGASVASAFSVTATASAGVVGVQFQVDGANVGAEDTVAPFTTSATAPGGTHTLTAVGRDANGNRVTSAAITVSVAASSGTALSINGVTTFQAGDGFGVNLNSLSWKNGELRPALDMLIDELGVQSWRVVFDMEDWEDPNDNADPNTPDWAYYNALYSNAKFQNLWGTLQYMNSKGVTAGIMISFMGRVPPWMGGPTISSTLEDEWVEMIATMLFYARNTAKVQFDMVDPLNEPDWDGLEGAQVGAVQYTRLLQKLSVRLDAMGLGDVKFVGPNTAQVTTGIDTYFPEMQRNSVVMSKLDHFGLHNYNGLSGGADAQIKGSAFPAKNFWMTELSIPEQVFDLIAQGAASAIIWDAYDSVYNHAILAGSILHDGRGSTPPNDAGNLPALLAYDSTAGTYSRRSQFRQMQAFKYVSRGSIRIAATESNSNLTVFAYRNAATGRVTIVGRNIGASSVTLSGSMTNVGAVGALQFYQTNNGDNFGSFTRGADAVVTSGAFVVTVPANSFFTLTSGQ